LGWQQHRQLPHLLSFVNNQLLWWSFNRIDQQYFFH
jgi:hypothetical protein